MAGTITAAKLSKPLTVLMPIAPSEIRVVKALPPVRSEKAGVYPSKAIMIDENMGPNIMAITQIDAPWIAKTLRICKDDAPLLLRRDVSDSCCSTSIEDSVIR